VRKKPNLILFVDEASDHEEVTMGKTLDGKVALITGANSGIGLAAAKRFAKEGARVFMTGRRSQELEAAAQDVGFGARAVQGDVSNLSDLDRLIKTIAVEAGHLDVLFANAGGGDFVPVQEVTEEHYSKTFDANVKGTLFTVVKALPVMRDGASVILTGSTAASTGTPAFSVYAASKAAIRSFARNWIIDLAPRRIRVNVLAPGATSTPGWHALAKSEAENLAMQAHVAATTPLGRLGTPEEIASAALFLASDESSFINGIELFADGGSAQI
jgi:NAD(P)-dependent dehydrogenase (short-subunit alcohol dehydrogenase family)